MNIIDYVENNKKTFNEEKFNEVDSLVLSQFCYIKLKYILCLFDSDYVSIKDLYDNGSYMIPNNTKKENLNLALFEKMASSPRYRDVRVFNHVDLFEDMLQFSATSFDCGNFIYSAFRGTDGTLVGWKEDFALSFMESIPSHIESVKYMNDVLSKTSLPILVGGHSKGGNLAIYSSMKCDSNDRIEKIYNHDGPGFSGNLMSSMEYKSIESLIDKTVPSGSFVGLFLDSTNNFKVIESTAMGVKQHNPFTWVVNNNSFVHLDNLSKESLRNGKAINEWINGLDNEKRERIVNIMFNVAGSSNKDYFSDIPKNFASVLPKMISSTKDLSKEEKKEFKGTVYMLVRTMRKR